MSSLPLPLMYPSSLERWTSIPVLLISSQQAPVFGHKRTREVDTLGGDSHVPDATFPVSHKRPRELGTSAPPTSTNAPVHVSPPRPTQEVGTSAPSTSTDDPVYVSPPRPTQEVGTSAPPTSTDAPFHVSPPRPTQEVGTSVPPTTSLHTTPEAFKLSVTSPSTLGSNIGPIERGFFDIGFSREFPTPLADVLEVDTQTDKFLDSMRRVGNKGSLTRPLKERKARWLFKHW